jgi:ankyrin repeat protein
MEDTAHITTVDGVEREVVRGGVEFTGLTPLGLAVVTGNVKAATLMLQMDPTSSNVQDASGNTAMHYAVHLKKMEMMDILIKTGADVNIRNSAGQKPIAVAIEGVLHCMGLPA